MKAKIIDSKSKPTPEAIADIETEVKHPLPEAYEKFILQHNGGCPDPSGFSFSLHGGALQEAMVAWFFAIHDGPYENLMNHIRTFKDRVPNTLLPFGRDPGGSLLCLGLEGRQRGAVFFWLQNLEGPDGEEPGFENIAYVADRLEDFLNSLHEPI